MNLTAEPESEIRFNTETVYDELKIYTFIRGLVSVTRQSVTYVEVILLFFYIIIKKEEILI